MRLVDAAIAAIVLTTTAVAGLAAPAVPFSEEAKSELPEGWYADIDTTLGTFTVRLLVEQAPQSVAHFVGFARGTIEYTDPFTGDRVARPLYDGLKIHSVTAGTRFEAGDPTATGRGAPPVWVPKENGPATFDRAHRMGTTSASLRRNSGSLFFVSAVAEPYLNASHNCFGAIVLGREAVDRILNVKTSADKVPLDPPSIEHVTVWAKGSPTPLPEPVSYTPPVPVIELKRPVSKD